MNQLNDTDFGQKIRDLIDGLKRICASYGLRNDGNEFKIITQVFLYKLMNDKFAFEVKRTVPEAIAFLREFPRFRIRRRIRWRFIRYRNALPKTS